MEQKIKEALDQIRPFLQRDGGDLEFVEYTEDNVVKVRLQGENKIGGTLSHYYVIRLDTLEESIVDKASYRSNECTREEANEYMGRYMNIGDNIRIYRNNEDVFNISKINKALKYYWDERLGNN